MEVSEADSSSNSSVHRRIGASDLVEDFLCAVCLRLAVDPTTLTCGHTSCRICLAQWFFNSKKKECPMCRQPYEGHPKTNYQMKNMILKLMPNDVAEREKELAENNENSDVVKKFDEALAKVKTKKSDFASFCAGIVIAVCIFVVAYLAWYWQSSDANMLVLKPVQTWRQKDVAAWLDQMSWASQYVPLAMEHKIDGNVLLSLTNESVKQLLNVTDTTHEHALLLAIEMLKVHGLKMPTTLWEYKTLYPGRCLFLVYGMKDFPRTTMLYLWLYFYDDMFLPFVKAIIGPTDVNLTIIAETEEVNTSDWMKFAFTAFVMPELLVVYFAWQMFAHHSFTPLFVLVTAILYQVLEYFTWTQFFSKHEWRQSLPHLKAWFRHLISAFIFMVLWPIVPSLICDVFFYGALYISPIQASIALYNKLVR